jgi:hypothetical protein
MKYVKEMHEPLKVTWRKQALKSGETTTIPPVSNGAYSKQPLS